jgi:lipopolysaccharide/colanic/teichoic acid biosynthesis glycosyltransferase
LRGEMSFVGPRPEVAEYTEMYSVEEQEILSVRPGITDLSSLTFSDLQSHVGSENPDEAFRRYVLPQKNRLRLKYAREHTILMDFIILMKTVLLVVAKPLKSLTQNGIHKSS